MKRLTHLVCLTCLLLCGVTAPTVAAPLTLVDQAQPRVSIVTTPEVLAVDPDQRGADPDLQLLRWAADDLATYLSQISGAEVAVGDQPVEGLIPIYVGSAPKQPELSVASEFGDAYLIDVSAERIVLAGESSRAVYYAAAHLLHDLGVRWYAPGELGESVPREETLQIEIGHVESAPDFQTRNLWADRRWALRNRMGGPAMAQGHAFHNLIEGGQHFEAHPEYYPVIGGKPVKTQANLSNPDVVAMFARNIAEQFRKGTHWAGGTGAGIGPDDGALLDERPESRAMDSGDLDPLLQLPDATDRFIKFANAVADQLDEEFPPNEYYLGFYVYSNHNMPPQTVEPHPMLFPIMAPITYNRYTSIGNPGAPTAKLAEHVTREWANMVPRMGTYLYNFNLADTAMPFTRRLTWTLTFPRLYDWGLRYATVESMDDNWHFQVPGNYVLGHILWDVETDVDALVDEFYPRYYGPAAEPMRRYHETLEQAYENTGAYAGNLWSMHLILAPEVMDTLHAALAEAQASVGSREDEQDVFAQRVEIQRIALNFADHWLAARDALNQGELAQAAEHAQAFHENFEAGSAKYPQFIGRRAWGYFRSFHNRSFEDAGRVAREGKVVYGFPDAWPAFLDKDGIGQEDELYRPETRLTTWTELKTFSASLAEQGFPYYRGLIWYRHDFELPEQAHQAQALRLWFGGVDDTAHVYLNGQSLGTHAPGNFGPFEVDVTEALDPEGDNVLVVAVDNRGITELGTGGLVRPVVLYVPADAEGEAGEGEGEGHGGPQGPLFGGE